MLFCSPLNALVYCVLWRDVTPSGTDKGG